MGCDFTFIHCADLHLGSRFWGLSRKDPELGKRMYDSTFRAFSRMVDIGKERADFMVIAGDIYDELVETPRTRTFFASELERFGFIGSFDFESDFVYLWVYLIFDLRKIKCK